MSEEVSKSIVKTDETDRAVRFAEQDFKARFDYTENPDGTLVAVRLKDIPMPSEIVIPSCVVEIADGAVSGRNDITSVKFLGGVKRIGDNAFAGCTALKTVEFPDTLGRIGESAFSLCTALETIVLRRGVATIGKNAFYGCHSITSVTLDFGLEEIGEGAFSGCMSLNNIVIPSTVFKIGKNAFSECRALTTAQVMGEEHWFADGTPFMFDENAADRLRNVASVIERDEFRYIRMCEDEIAAKKEEKRMARRLRRERASEWIGEHIFTILRIYLFVTVIVSSVAFVVLYPFYAAKIIPEEIIGKPLMVFMFIPMASFFGWVSTSDHEYEEKPFRKFAIPMIIGGVGAGLVFICEYIPSVPGKIVFSVVCILWLVFWWGKALLYYRGSLHRFKEAALTVASVISFGLTIAGIILIFV